MHCGDSIPEDETPEDETPEVETSEDETPEDETPEDEAPVEEIPEDEILEDETLAEDTPENLCDLVVEAGVGFEAFGAATVEIEALSTHQISGMVQTGVTRLNTAFRRGTGANYGLIRTVTGSTNARITGRTGDWYRINTQKEYLKRLSCIARQPVFMNVWKFEFTAL